MNAKKLSNWIALTIVASLLLGACAQAKTPTPEAVPTQAEVVGITPIAPMPTKAAAAAAPAAEATPEAAASSTPSVDTQVVSEDQMVLDDFEGKQTSWKPGTEPESTARMAALSTENAVLGKQSLALTFDWKTGAKPAFVLTGNYDLDRAQQLQFNLTDPEGSLQSVAIALATGPEPIWYESEPAAVKQGVNTLTFDLHSNKFKTNSTNWQTGALVSNLDKTQKIAVMLFPKIASTVYMDNLMLMGLKPVAVDFPACSGQAAGFASDAPLAISLPQDAAPQQYKKVELDLATTFKADNPYDSSQVDLVVTFSGPEGEKITVPAFWYQNFDEKTLNPCGKPVWKVRFTPSAAGNWTAKAEIRRQNLASDPLTFEVAAGTDKGFVRVSTVNTRYLAFDDNSTFFPIGVNLGGWKSDPLGDYTRWLDALHENGANAARIFMNSGSFGVEWTDTGLGNYTARQRQAWLLDKVFQMAEDRDIYLNLVLLDSDAFRDKKSPEWVANPYNYVNGGPCDKPECFMGSMSAQEYFKQRIRYIASRWAYSTHLMSWEWWNNLNITPIPNETFVPWLVIMSSYLESVDPYNHLQSLSYAGTISPTLYDLQKFDYSQYQEYSIRDSFQYFPDQFKRYSVEVPGKPVLFSEYGYSSEKEDNTSKDKGGVHLHNGLWAATFSGFASPAYYWWWDSYIDALNLWGQYAPLSTFLQGQDLAQLNPGSGTVYPFGASALTLQNDTKALVWVRNNLYQTANAIQAYDQAAALNQVGEGWRYEPPQVDKHSLTVSGLEDGTYKVSFFDPLSGKWLSETTTPASGGKVTLVLPAFSTDLAVKIEK